MNPFITIAVTVMVALACAWQLPTWSRILMAKILERRQLAGLAPRWRYDTRFMFALGHVVLDLALFALCSTWALNIWIAGPRPATALRIANTCAAVGILVAKELFIWAAALEQPSHKHFWRFQLIAAAWLGLIGCLAFMR